MRQVQKRKSPWDVEEAFDPMFDEEISIKSGDRKITVPCVVFSDVSGDVLTDAAIQTDRMDISIIVKNSDWAFIGRLNVGDVIERVVNGKVIEYRFSEIIEDLTMGKRIIARSATCEDEG